MAEIDISEIKKIQDFSTMRLEADIHFPRNNIDSVEQIPIGYRWRRDSGEGCFTRTALELARGNWEIYFREESDSASSFTIPNQITFKD